jgi:cytochrome c oxidase subunit III
MTMAHAHNDHAPAGKYYVPHASHWPIFGSITMFITMLGAASWLNYGQPAMFFVGLALLMVLFFGWFRDVIGESVSGTYNAAVDRSFRMGMIWFIFSEVMFFAAFFGALYYARNIAQPWLSGEGVKFANSILWKDFAGTWPSNGPSKIGGEFETIPAFSLPALNTLILLTSGVTITIAHHALKDNKRVILNVFLALTFLLGFLFVFLQANEYMEAYREYNLKLSTGIYGSTFFMLTGFHGLHVTVGAIMLTVIWLRCLRGHFKPENHFGFEAVAWYWHFVDVVWLGLFIFVYWL